MWNSHDINHKKYYCNINSKNTYAILQQRMKLWFICNHLTSRKKQLFDLDHVSNHICAGEIWT